MPYAGPGKRAPGHVLGRYPLGVQPQQGGVLVPWTPAEVAKGEATQKAANVEFALAMGIIKNKYPNIASDQL